MPDTFQLGGYDLITDEPYRPLSGSEILRQQVKRQREQQEQNAKLRRQAALDQHLQQFGDDPVSRAWGEAEFRLKENESALTARKQQEDEIGGQFDDPVAKAWAIAGQRLKGTDQPAVRAAQSEAEAMEALQRQYQQSAALDRVTPDNAFVRETVGGMLNAAPDFVSIAARLTGNGEAADELTRQSQEFQQARGALRETDWSPWLSGMYGGAVQNITQMAGTPGGAYGKIGGAALMSGNQALTTAEDAGLEGGARLRYAGTQALLEGGIAAIFQKLGLGGVEARLGGQAVASQTWKQLAKSVGKDALQEMPEEAITSILQDLSSKLEGVSPDMGFGEFVQHAGEAAVQAAMMSGLANTKNAAKLAAKSVVELFVAKPSRKNYEQLPEELKQGPANQAQREALAEKLKQAPAAQGPTPEEQAAIDEENRITALKSPGAQPDFVPLAQPGEEVIPDQGPSVTAPPVIPETMTPPGGPAAQIPNPEQGASDAIPEEDEQRRTGQQGLLSIPETEPQPSTPQGDRGERQPGIGNLAGEAVAPVVPIDQGPPAEAPVPVKRKLSEVSREELAATFDQGPETPAATPQPVDARDEKTNDGSATRPSGEPYSQKQVAPVSSPALPEGAIGVNQKGQPVFEDKNGVRSYLDGRIRVTEGVVMVPTKAGVAMQPRPAKDRSDEFQVVDPANAPSLSPTATAPQGGQAVPTQGPPVRGQVVDATTKQTAFPGMEEAGRDIAQRERVLREGRQFFDQAIKGDVLSESERQQYHAPLGRVLDEVRSAVANVPSNNFGDALSDAIDASIERHRKEFPTSFDTLKTKTGSRMKTGLDGTIWEQLYEHFNRERNTGRLSSPESTKEVVPAQTQWRGVDTSAMDVPNSIKRAINAVNRAVPAQANPETVQQIAENHWFNDTEARKTYQTRQQYAAAVVAAYQGASSSVAEKPAEPKLGPERPKYPEQGPIREDWFGPDKAREIEWTKTVSPVNNMKVGEYGAAFDRDGKRVAAGIVRTTLKNAVDIQLPNDQGGGIKRFFYGHGGVRFAVGRAIQKAESPVDAGHQPSVPETAKPERPPIPARSVEMMNTAIAGKDVAKLKEMVHPDNRSWRDQFIRQTGVKLPRTVSGSEQAVEQWANQAAQKTGQEPAKSGKTPSPEAQAANEKLASSRKKLANLLRNELGSTGLSTETLAALRDYTLDFLNAGYHNFKDFVRQMADELGPVITRKAGPTLSRGWTNIRDAYDTKMDEAGDVGKIVDEWESEQGPKEPASSPHVALAKSIAEALSQNANITQKSLSDFADAAYGGTRAEGQYGPSDAYDALEAGVNQHLSGQTNPTADLADVEQQAAKLRSLIDTRIPRQGARSGEKDEMQQFSTPPDYGLAVAWLANIKPSDVVLEPSAGTGSLAIQAKNAGATVYTNELSERRREFLDDQGYAKTFGEDAEQIQNILKTKMPSPDVVVMNPPFSRAANRMGDKMVAGTDLKHIDSALSLVKPGGRLVAIVGAGLHGETNTLIKWIQGLHKRGLWIRANVPVGRDAYKGYGTSFPTRVLIIDKAPKPEGAYPVTGSVDTITELMRKLEEVRGDRQQTAQPSGEGESKPSQPSVPATPEVAGVRPTRTPDRPVSTAQPEPVDDRTGGTGRGTRGDSGGAPVEKPARPAEALARRDGPDRDVADPGTAGSSEPVSGDPEGEDSGRIGRVERVKKKSKTSEEESHFSRYQPELSVPGTKPHPANLVESAAMAAVQLPAVDYKSNLPAKIIADGKLSDAQVEQIVLAGSAHSKTLPNGERGGYMIGDGTGVGKGREISGVILDNFQQGRKKAVWVSINSGLLPSAQRDWSGIGQNKDDIFELPEIGGDMPKTGIVFTTYPTLKSKNKKNETRLDQLANWLGADFDGVIVFDEAHKMANAQDSGQGQKKQKASQQALAGVELQRRLPNARILYVSATAASDVRNLAYADRLGLWGPGTEFNDKTDFINNISAGGVATMELVAQNMKAMGVYHARAIDYSDVTQSPLEQKLDFEQRAIYDRVADAWQTVFGNVMEAIGLTERDTKSASYALSAFYSSQQRFFNSLLTAMSLPKVIEKAESDLKAGKSVVVQITQTGGASQDRALANMEEGDDYEDVVISPFEQLYGFVERSFPTQQYETYLDEDGNEQTRPVVDSEGNPVHNQEAVEKKASLLADLGSLEREIPVSPLDQLIEHFGAEAVAEVTGRTERLVHVRNDKGEMERIRQPRSERARLADAKAFMDGKKRILIFSEAGGTGMSYHADRTEKNQEQRVHYLLQAGWSAFAAVQGLGRTHRSNQASAPQYVLVSTDLPGHKRFVSTIARRLSQLGALTRGQRQAASNELFSERDNLENKFSQEALEQFLKQVAQNAVEGVGVDQFQKETGLRLIGSDGSLLVSKIKVPQFLNRLLALKVDFQNSVFDAFSGFLDGRLDMAKQTGELNQGVEAIKAEKIEKLDDRVVHTDPRTGAEVRYVKLKVWNKAETKTFEQGSGIAKFVGFYQSTKSGKIWAVSEASSRTDYQSGRVVPRVRRVGPTGQILDDADKLDNDKQWRKVHKDEARKLWDEQLAEVPALTDMERHMLTGALLTVWNKLPSTGVTVQRATLADGSQVLGRVMTADEMARIASALGMDAKTAAIDVEDALRRLIDGKVKLKLGNGWKLQPSRVGGSRRIELVGPSFYSKASLQQQGVIVERVAHEDRYFIPNGENQRKVLDRVLERDRVVEVMGVRQDEDDDGPTINRGRAPASFGDVTPQPWASTEAESGGGKKLLSRMAADSRSDDPSIGLRSVVEFLNELAHTVLVVGRTQTTKRHPAHFTGDAKGRGVYGPAIIRSRFGSSQLNFHEAGHALSNWLRDSDPRFFFGLGEQLKDVAKMPGFASAKTAEEGIAEVVRRFVVGETVPAELWSSLEKRLEKDQPDVLAGLRDAHRAYVFHRGRPQEQQMRANAGDQPPNGDMLAGLRNTLYWMAYNTFGGSWVIHRINRKLFTGISGSGWLSGGTGMGEMVRNAVSGKSRSLTALARAVRSELRNKPTDTEAAYQARMHTADEVARVMGGVRGDREGVRVLQLGDSLSHAATADGLEALRQAGFDIPDEVANAPYGEYVYLSTQSFAKIKHALGDRYQSFEVYAQYKAALSRWNAKRLDYPGMHDGLTPAKLKAFIEETEASHPDWQVHFKDVQKLTDQMVLVGVMSGEHSVESAINIRQSFEDYVPLPRQVEDRASYLGIATGGASPTSGVYRAKGSLLDFRPLEESIEYRVRRSMTAYYENALRVSMLKMTDAINKDSRLPYDVRKTMARLMLPLRMESKRIATMTPLEAQEVVADAMNRMAAEKEGIDVEGVSPKQLAALLEVQGLESFRPEDIALSLPGKPIYRQAAPRAVHVVTTFRHGELAYHQVTDPLLFDLFSGTKHLKPYLSWVARFAGKPLLPWRRMLTQNIAFALRNLPRDAITAMQLGEGVSSVIPGYVAGTALLNRLQGDPEGHRAQARSELLAKSLDHTNSDAHGTLWDSFRLMLGEGITDTGWSQLSSVDRGAEIPGIVMSALMKPIDVANWLTGGRWLSEQTESLPREGAFIAAKKRGDTTARAIRSYDRVTGQFIQRQPNAELQAVVRASGFLNPAIQIIGGQLEAMTDPDPASRAAFLAVKLPMLTAWAAVGAALNYMMILAMTDDDEAERQRIFRQMKERTEQDRLGTMSLGGVVRLPFDKGLAGAAVSFGWNDTEDWLYGVSPQVGAERATALLERATDVPIPTDMVHPFWQVARDLWQNHSEYMDADIVPQFLERKYPNNPELQTLPDVAETFNQIGRATKSSPLKIRYAMRGVLGSDVVSLLQMMDNGVKTPSDLPVIGRLISRDPQGWSSRSVRSVIDLDNQYVAAMATAEGQPMTPELKIQIDRTRNAHQAMLEIERIWSGAKTKEQKEAAQKEMTDVASRFVKSGALTGNRINLLWEHAIGNGQKKAESTQILKTLRVDPQQKSEALKALDAEFVKLRNENWKKSHPHSPKVWTVPDRSSDAYKARRKAIQAM